MNSPMTDGSHDTSTQKSKKIISLINKLRRKVINFDVVDNKGILIGRVKDLVFNTNRQLTFVIEKLSQGQETHFLLLLNGKLVNQVEPKTRRVFANIDKSQLTQLLEYEKKGK